MTAGQRMWPGFRQDGEADRLEQERHREQRIKADNLSARIRADAQPDAIDPATGRTFRDAQARGMYDDASQIKGFREMNERNRQTRERFRWAQVRLAGRAGRN